jgi:anion-transporting  ArsA/GET3 family ATPase
VQDVFEKRIALITGKGGVGRTTITAALARAAAARGIRVLVTEITEPDGDYTPLARIFGRDNLPVEPEELEPGIKGCVLWYRRGHEHFFHRVIPLKPLVRAAMRSSALRKLLDSAPSFREMGVFNHMFALAEERRPDGEYEHELMILDMPASGHTLGLTGLRRRLLELMPTGPIAQVLDDGRAYFIDPKVTGAFVVTLPETLPVTECLELIEGLQEHGTPVGGIIVNRVIEDPFTPEERAALEPHSEANLYGMARFKGIPNSAKALQHLRDSTDQPIHEIPEYPLGDSELIDAIAKTLDDRDEAAA